MNEKFEAYLFLNEGFEEIEAVAPIDILRRGKVKLATVSLSGNKNVTGSHGITVAADTVFNAEEFITNNPLPGCMLILPGGPGTPKYKNNSAFLELLTAHNNSGGRLAAICAAPSVLGELGILNGKTACCYPGYEPELTGAAVSYDNVETDLNITTSRSAATAFEFGLELLRLLKGEDTAEKVRESMPQKN